jgi:drug/metabolite transporter (DMT)-like permease
MNAYLAAFISSLIWAAATQFYARIVTKTSVFRFNFYKSLIALVCFFIASLLIGQLVPSWEAMQWLLLSGFIGFAVADLFIFYSFAKNGPARTLIFSAFSPALIAVYSYSILQKTLPTNKMIGLSFLILCLIFLGFERKRRKGKISLRIALLAVIGINLEALGIVFTKKAFLVDPNLSSMTANLYRVIPAVIFLGLVNHFTKIKILMSDLSNKMKLSIVFSSFMGTFLALYLFLYAISKYNHPSIISAIASLAPLYASIYEHWRDKELPNKYFVGAMISMGVGVFILLYG